MKEEKWKMMIEIGLGWAGFSWKEIEAGQERENGHREGILMKS